MNEITAVNGIINAEVLYYSRSRKGVFLRVWNDEKPHIKGQGWQSWNPYSLPSIGEILPIHCARVTFRDTFSQGKSGQEPVRWEQVDFRRN
ncbi:hypothetical protein [Spirosoma linguale]|uniref:Uncharacterized protein n=1 Tax=Spirosoma linguale (strain ATCC 33905 / DSM 74 / LMG 10896 / Claus 1) TaxID=504472 RepID=D2QTI6_SPILD|nr:hypothetical protein Slin_6158 [Spirosoma linguale DSM 74]